MLDPHSDSVSVNRSVTLENIVFHKGTGAAKLCNFGFYHLTVEGKAVEYFVGDMAFSAPEVISAGLSCNLWFPIYQI